MGVVRYKFRHVHFVVALYISPLLTFHSPDLMSLDLLHLIPFFSLAKATFG